MGRVSDLARDDVGVALSAPIFLIDDYGREHVLTDVGDDMLEGQLDLDDGPMLYWIPRSVADTWRAVT